MPDVLVDTSAWISFLRRGRGKGPVADMVEKLVRKDRAALTGPVLGELLQGAKGKKEAQELAELLDVVPYLEVTRADWESAGETLRKLRAKGVTIPLTDAVVAAVAERHSMSVLTEDAHFDHLTARHTRV